MNFVGANLFLVLLASPFLLGKFVYFRMKKQYYVIDGVRITFVC